MSDIAPLGSSVPVSYQPNGRVDRQAATQVLRSRASDRTEISETARLLSKLTELPEVRQALVDRIRHEIAAGTYETPDKLDAAVDGLAEDLR